MLLVMVTCQAPVLMLNGARLAAATTVAVNTATTNTILLCICVPCLRLLLEAQWRGRPTGINAVSRAPRPQYLPSSRSTQVREEPRFFEPPTASPASYVPVV